MSITHNALPQNGPAGMLAGAPPDPTIMAQRRRISWALSFFMIGLAVSGITAIPLEWGINLLHGLIGPGTLMEQYWPAMSGWIGLTYQAISANAERYPMLFYGTDWLAFAHIVLAIAFIGPLRDPVRNIWVVEFGLIACVLVIPMALIFGPIRQIPFFWQLIDCSFGVFGFIPLWLVRRWIVWLERREGTG
jgi:hypothetical protein